MNIAMAVYFVFVIVGVIDLARDYFVSEIRAAEGEKGNVKRSSKH